jgi:transcriptional regulator with XRE-family HTH domain
MSPHRAPEPNHEDNRAADTDLGKALKEARLARGHSLAQVAAATGISKSLLSLIENNRSDVTLRRLTTLAEHYETHIADLLPAKASPDPVVTRRAERRRLHSGKEGLDLHVLAPDTNRKMLPIVAVFAPGGAAGEYWSHEGEELVVVLEGRLLVEIDGSPPVVLEQGDTAYYDCTRRHRWSNLADGVTRVISVATPATNL